MLRPGEGVSAAASRPVPAGGRRDLPRRLRLRAASLAIDLAWLAASPILLVWLLIASRGLTRPKLRRGLRQKLAGPAPREGSARCLWVHAVSVGEVLTAAPLVREVRRRWPAWDLRLSVSTFTGLEVARKSLPEITAFYFPLDISFVVRRFFRRVRPDAVVLLELELWPNFLIEASLRGVPVLVANGRITERSAGRYARGGGAVRGIFRLVTSYGAQSADHAARFQRLGAAPERVEVLGNLKHDRGPRPAGAAAGELRRRLGWDAGKTTVLTAGSTHPGEEELLLRIHAALRQTEPGLRLVIVPRHVERLDPGGSEMSRWGASEPLVRWSGARAESPPLRDPDRCVLVVDTLGELELFYALADLVFVGGSLVPHGGHNVLEASGLGKPVLLGPHHANFRDEADVLLAAGAAAIVEDGPALEREVRRLAAEPESRKEMGRRALEATERLGGSLERHLAWLDRYLQLSSPAGAG